MASTVAALICAWTVHGGATITAAYGWLYLDALSGYHLAVMMAVFLLSSVYLPGYFRDEIRSGELTPGNARRFGALWFSALTAMTLVLLSNNIGIMWVSIEATTLVTAFLISVHRSPASVEATWKYLVICSVGVAFAFMGTLLVGAAAKGLDLPASQALLWTRLQQDAVLLNPPLAKVAFLFLLVGYGTKAGLAPMHSWLPDAHSQAPAPVSALFSGFMLNAALYCIMRYMPLIEACTGHVGWSLRLLKFFGLASILVAAAFIIFQHDLKRLLAYHSVEHLGIIAVGLGLGGLGIFAALLHTLNHSLCKSLSFFAAGRLGQMYGTHDMPKMAGSLKAAPVWGKALLGSLLVLIGVAPFAVFISEFLILRAAAQSGSYWTMGLFLAGAGIVFVGALQHAINITWGDAVATPEQEQADWVEKAIVAVPMTALLLLGLWIPDSLREMLEAAALIVKGAP
ncbi:hydrogenase 4 subunit F [Candidatus Poribacteria bacterium]|nr:hydrogenase 4 subunit F [Candidatus Poribacteria bacterium]